MFATNNISRGETQRVTRNGCDNGEMSIPDASVYSFSVRAYSSTGATSHRQGKHAHQTNEQQDRHTRRPVIFESYESSGEEPESEEDGHYIGGGGKHNKNGISINNLDVDDNDEKYDDSTTGLRVPCREDVVARLCGMLKGEVRMVAPRSDYIESVQNGGMSTVWRARICEWLLEFVDEFDLTVDTVAVAVLNIDRYMSCRTVEGCIVQLVAMAAIMVASKVHEPYPLQVNDVQWLAEGVYCESDIRLMELDLLHTIGWDANPVTSYQFMRHFSLLQSDFEDLHNMLQPALDDASCVGRESHHKVCDEGLALFEEFEARCLRAEWFLDLAMSGKHLGVDTHTCIHTYLHAQSHFNEVCLTCFCSAHQLIILLRIIRINETHRLRVPQVPAVCTSVRCGRMCASHARLEA
jgi:hypothetical protein